MNNEEGGKEGEEKRKEERLVLIPNTWHITCILVAIPPTPDPPTLGRYSLQGATNDSTASLVNTTANKVINRACHAKTVIFLVVAVLALLKPPSPGVVLVPHSHININTKNNPLQTLGDHHNKVWTKALGPVLALVPEPDVSSF